LPSVRQLLKKPPSPTMSILHVWGAHAAGVLISAARRNVFY
jgi:hypothetical protein